ncbi:hypothetical protein J2Z21_008759 [Streptomyces griseochromogenes]|uniref:Uncharacterized protein n=1 Tax=Streptomyces griseochromogenes TaxID=68214 RepID=A0ABS4M7W0_9ACTN|nr:hypothetical protein [Streptomyces griseochromogenes]
MSTSPALDPTHTALLVMDYQSAILTLLPEGDGKALRGRVPVRTDASTGMQDLLTLGDGRGRYPSRLTAGLPRPRPYGPDSRTAGPQDGKTARP